MKSREHDIDLVMYEGNLAKLPREVFDKALTWGKGAVKVRTQGHKETLLSSERTCPVCGFSVPELDPRWFSFNTKQGRCMDCEAPVEGGAEALAGRALGVVPHLRGLAPGAGAARREAGGLSLPRGGAAVRHRDVRTGARVEVPRRPGAARRPSRPGAAAAPGVPGPGGAGLPVPGPECVHALGRRDAAAAAVRAARRGPHRRDVRAGRAHHRPAPADTHRLLSNLRALVDTGSTVLVVEHDTDTIRAADHLIELGPTGGRGGGRILAEGSPEKVLQTEDAPTARALREPAVLAATPRGSRRSGWS